jgi:hypothetical protein
VSKRMKADFDEICHALGKTATEQLRELVSAFVTREYGRLDDRVTVHIFQPPGYDYGVWRTIIKLRNPAEMTWVGKPIPFHVPELPKRRLHSDPEYLAVVFDQKTQEPDLGGQFVEGEWRGHLYSNGCAEAENPTAIADVRSALTSTVEKIIDRFSSARVLKLEADTSL